LLQKPSGKQLVELVRRSISSASSRPSRNRCNAQIILAPMLAGLIDPSDVTSRTPERAAQSSHAPSIPRTNGLLVAHVLEILRLIRLRAGACQAQHQVLRR
jgi:hypothetical protein